MAPKTTAASKKKVTKTTPKTPSSASKTTPKTTTGASKTTPRTVTTRKTTATRKTTPSTPTSETTPQPTTIPPKTASPKTASLHTSPQTTTAAPKTATVLKPGLPVTTTSPKPVSPETATTPKPASQETVTCPKPATPETAPRAVITSPKASKSPKATSFETTTTAAATLQTTSEIAKVAQTASSKCKEATSGTTITPKTAPKTTTKIKKKIVKRKVIKRVKVKKEEKLQLLVADENPNPNANSNPNPNPNQAIEMENPSSEPAETDRMDSENLKSENPKEENDVENKEGEEENESEKGGEGAVAGEEEAKEARASERHLRRKTEIFIGGLDRDAREEDIRKVFGKIGEVLEIRLMKNTQTGKNKGYAFLRYASPADAKRAITEFAKVEVCGKQCGAVPVEGNETIFLGNIDKTWKKEDVMKVLQEIGIENIDSVTVIADHNDPDCNRGFAFIELETNKDAQIAFKKLQKKDVFGKNRNIKVSWAEPLAEPDEQELLKVKSVYAEGIPSSWDEEKVKKHFKKFGEIERVALSRNIQSARRKDFAIVNFKTRESALSCIESFKTEELIDEGSKLNVKVSLAKPIPKNKQSKGGSKSIQDYSKEKLNVVNRASKVKVPINKGKSVGHPVNSGSDKKSSTAQELVQVLREQAAWSQGYMGVPRGSAYQDHAHALHGGKRPFTSLGDDMIYSDPRVHTRARLDNTFPVEYSSYSTLSHRMSGTSLPYYQQLGADYTAGTPYGTTSRSSEFQVRQGAASYLRDHYRRS